MKRQILEIERLKRVVVVGTSGSGKTTFAKNLARILNVKHIELDAINWLPDWVERPPAEFIELVKMEIAAGSWVLDGNYSRTRETVWSRATAIVWLDYSFPRTIYRSLYRTTRRVITGERICSGNRETFRQSFLSRDSVVLWALKTYHRRRREYAKLLENGDDIKAREIYIFRTPRQAERFLRQIKEIEAARED